MDQAELVESRYKFTQLPNGFIVDGGEGRIPMEVMINGEGTAFNIQRLEDGKKHWGIPYINPAAFVEGRALVGGIVNGLMSDWMGDKKKWVKTSGKGQVKLRKWAYTKVGKAIGKRVKAERLRLIEKADPTILAVQKAVFASAGKIPSDIKDGSFYKNANPYYLKDIINYRAAALTTFGELSCGNTDMLNSDWRKAYVLFGEEVYGSLRKTLTKLPGGIPVNILTALQLVHLERPVYSRRELLFMLGAASHFDWVTSNENIKHIILNVTSDEVTRAAKLLGAHLRSPINLRKAFEVDNMGRYIMDAAPHLTHNGNIVGLMEKAIEWHRQAAWSSCGLPADTLSTLPPLPLPTHKGVYFLKDVREIVEEGKNQHHCISSYAKEAVRGSSYLFHIEYAGETASAQIGVDGRVIQCYGPYNRENKASRWAKTYLDKWGESLRGLNITPRKDVFDDPFIDDMPF